MERSSYVYRVYTYHVQCIIAFLCMNQNQRQNGDLVWKYVFLICFSTEWLVTSCGQYLREWSFVHLGLAHSAQWNHNILFVVCQPNTAL